MTIGDIFSALTYGKITTNFGHNTSYWIEDNTRIEKELSANIMSAYLTNNKDTLNIIKNISGLREIKEKVVKEYGNFVDEIRNLIHKYMELKGKRPKAFNYDEWNSFDEYKEYLEELK